MRNKLMQLILASFIAAFSAQSQALKCDEITVKYPKIEDMLLGLNPYSNWCKTKSDRTASCSLARENMDQALKCYASSLEPREDIKVVGFCGQVFERFTTKNEMEIGLNPYPKWCKNAEDMSISCELGRQRLESAKKCYEREVKLWTNCQEMIDVFKTLKVFMREAEFYMNDYCEGIKAASSECKIFLGYVSQAAKCLP